MVTAAVPAARPISDASLALAADLGALLHTRVLIRIKRWDLHATLGLVPALRRHGIPLDRVRADVTRLVEGCTCPRELRPVTVAMLVTEMCMPAPRTRVLELAAAALWRRDWMGAVVGAASCALASGTHSNLDEVRKVAAGRADRQLDELARRGFVDRRTEPYAWGDFVGDSGPGTERRFDASLPLVAALASAICAAGTDAESSTPRTMLAARLHAAERVVARLPARDRWLATAHLARAVLSIDGERAALAVLRSIRPASVRAAGGLMLVRAALDGACETGERIASTIESSSMRERAQLAIAWQLAATQPVRARWKVARIEHRELQADCWRLRTAIAMRLRPRTEPSPIWPHGHLEHARVAPAWTGLADLEPQPAARAMLAVILLRSGLAGSERCRIAAARQLRHLHEVAARRELLGLAELVGLDSLDVVRALRAATYEAYESNGQWPTSTRTDALFAEQIVLGARRIAASAIELPQPLRDGLANRQAVEEPETVRPAARSRFRGTDHEDAAVVRELLGQDRSKLGEASAPATTPLSHEIASEVTIAACIAHRRPTKPADRGSLERALFDEGVALRADPEGQRRAIINAARACVRGAIERPIDQDPDAIAVRLRTLAHLGGGLAKDALAGALAIRPGLDAYVPALLSTLCEVDARAAAHAAIERATRPRRARDELRDRPDEAPLLREAELHGGLPQGFAAAWTETVKALATALGNTSRHPDDAARAWLAGWVLARDTQPSTETLAWIARRARSEVPMPVDAQALIAEATDRASEIATEWPIAAASRAAGDDALLDAIRIAERPKLEPAASSWTHAEWVKHLRRAASVQTGTIDRPMVARCARRLGRPELVRWLLAGDLAAFGVERTREIAGGLRVKLLDNRLDLLTYLRFADVPTWSCFRSNSGLYRGNRDDVIAVWKDPLTFCFRIEKLDRRPWGFVFGGFAELENGALAITLNGLYLQEQTIEVRSNVLGAIQRMLAPLGVRELGIGCHFSGEGPLPDPYRLRTVTGTRWRALRIGGEIVHRTYDDISYVINRSAELELWWG